MCKRTWAGALLVAVLFGLGVVVDVAQANSEKELVVVSWGGTTAAAKREAYYKPFEEATGIKVIEDTNPDNARIRAMVESKNVTWDLVDIAENDMLALSKLGFLEPVSDKYFDSQTKAELFPGAIKEYGVAALMYSQVLGWNMKKYNQQTAPKSWKEFWDVKRFPGTRTLFAGTYVIPPLEVALLADGVPPDKLYPLDIDRAFKSLDRIKPHIVKWTTSSPQPMQMLVAGEADLVLTAYSRISKAKYDDNAPLDFHFNEALLLTDYWSIVKGASHRENALKFIAFASDAKRQAKMVTLQRFGPVNRNAFKYLTKEQASILPTYEPSLKTQIPYGTEFWAQVREGKTMKEYVAELWNRWILK